MNKVYLRIISIAILSALIMGGSFYIAGNDQKRHVLDERSNTLRKLSTVRAKLEGVINSTLLLTQGLLATIKTNPDISVDEFNPLARELINRNKHIRNIGLAKDNVITHMYPLKGNEKAVGLRYMDNEKQRDAVLRVIESRNTIVAGPVNLVQGGEGFISRTPIFLHTEEGKEKYWGIVSIVLRVDSLFKEAGLLEVTTHDLQLAIRGHDGLGEKGKVFFGKSSMFATDPVLLDVTLPVGSWQIAAIPASGWTSTTTYSNLIKASGILISFLMSLALWLYGRLSDEIVEKKLHEAMAESERKVHALAESLSEITYRADPNTFSTSYINNAVEKIFGYSKEEWMGNPGLWPKNIYPEDREKVFKKMDSARKEKKGGILEHRIITKNGDIRWVEDHFVWEQDQSGNITSLNGLVYDITLRKSAEKELQRTYIELNLIMDTVPDLIFMLDIKGNIVNCNKALEKATGASAHELGSKNIIDLISSEDGAPIKDLIDKAVKDGCAEKEIMLSTQNEGLVPHLFTIKSECANGEEPSILIGTGKSLKEHKKLEEERLKTEKIESIGILAGGIAHDFNNMLTSVFANISYVEKNDALSQEAREKLKLALSSSTQAKHLTQQLISFAKGGTPVLEASSIQEIFNSCLQISLSGSDTKSVLTAQPDIWPVNADKEQIAQVINNLIINADQSMPGGGTIYINLENYTKTSRNNLHIKNGDYVKLTIRDHGSGIDSADLPKIFDPYYTNKSKGHGLGLTTSYSIIKKHCGFIDVESEKGKGTSFYLYLPAADKVAEPQSLIKTEIPETLNKRILLMDDEERIRDSISILLKGFGCHVETAACGEEALRLFTQANAEGNIFDAVVLDLTVPGGVGGEEAIRGMAKVNSGVKAIVTSGYSNNDIMSNYKKYGFSDMLPKPYDIEQLVVKISRL